jgi:hypothetical protein
MLTATLLAGATVNNKGEEVESWAIFNQLILIKKPEDQATYYSRSWKTAGTRTPDIAFATNSVQKILHIKFCTQLGGSDHRLSSCRLTNAQ